MGADVAPVGVFGEDDARLVAIGDGHDMWQVLDVMADVQVNPIDKFAARLHGSIGNVLEIVQSVVQRIMDERMIVPII